VLAILCWFIASDFMYPYFVVGAVLLATISFADDLSARPASIRFSFQCIAFLLMAFQVGVFDQSWLIIICIIVVGMGTINAFNFMDGINGITGLYALVNLTTFLYLRQVKVLPVDESFIIVMIISVLIFLYFNFRKRARCFAGDIGSVVLAFVQLFLLLQLIFSTGNYGWVLLFLLFGVDSVVTIIYRLKRKENIVTPHRTHLYQYFSNERGKSHRVVSLVYAILQLGINFLLINYLINVNPWVIVSFSILMGLIYVVIRETLLKKIKVDGIFS
jgi:UDP-GlcNAc:undecaprenyl-phosphate/decaprenyl-phosphate GlcNAc-1-phosphate transferase